MKPSVNTDLLRSRVDTFVLNSLYEKDGYGYDILNYIRSKTQGHYEMKQSSIYSVLKRLEKQGYIRSYLGQESKGGPRRYYSLSDKGREFLESEQKEWAYTRTLINNLVTDTPFDLEKDTPPFKPSDLRPLTRRTRTEDKYEENPAAQGDKTKEVEQRIAQRQEAKKELFSGGAAEKAILDSIKESKEIDRANLTKVQEKPINTEYRNIFSEIYAKSEVDTVKKQPKDIPSYEDEELDCRHINDLKNILKNEGFNLKAYKKDEMLGINSANMVYSNKLFRDASLLSFLYYVLCVLVIYRFKIDFGYSDKALLAIGLCGIVFPVTGLIKFLIEPKRRIKAVFNFKVVLAYSLILYLLIFVVNVIICLVTPTIAYTMKDPQMYPPVIIASFIPFSIVFYWLLLKSGLYNCDRRNYRYSVN